jgi:trans-2,3-dihydro-3-hydroxyanthranilate isomerase
VPDLALGVPHQVRLVDVFTDKPLSGNQLAVVLDAQDIPAAVMQRIAREMNISETTFVLPPDDPANAARVRIFTPGSELPFAGHPTVGTAWVLFNEGLVPGGALEFTLEEGVGPVPVRGVNEAGGLMFWMSHPKASFGEIVADRAAFASSLGLSESDLLPDVPVQAAQTGGPFLFAALRNPDAVDRAVPGTFRKLAELPVFIFAVARPNRLYSRMFAGEVLNIPEDPATGAASGPLGAFAVKYGLVPRATKVAIVSEQGTKMGRQSFIRIELTYAEPGDIPTRIDIGGSVMPVLSGTLSDFSG